MYTQKKCGCVQIKIYLETWILLACHDLLTLVLRVGMYMDMYVGTHVHRKLVVEWAFFFATTCRKSELGENMDQISEGEA